ncbi:hypothetical protein [Anaerovibrio sp.]|uniref:hypothetical protein n=1 Tax=Anaerovibrio sp. TaxID=1872532 RepID=UPI00389113D1
MRKIIIMACMMYLVLMCSSALAATSVNVNQESHAGIDWDRGSDSDITAIGISLPDSRGMALAREAAIMAAQRNLVSYAQGLQINSETTMRDLIIESDVVNRKITGVLRGAKIIEENATPEGGYYVKMRVPLYGASGSIASAVIPALQPEQPTPFAKANDSNFEDFDIPAGGYTGVIIDASGMGVEPTFAPAVYDESGRVVYGVENLQPETVINKGMVGYSHSTSEGVDRAGDNPLVVKALEARDGNSTVNAVNVVVSAEDADKILLANESSHMLDRCAVVFVR